MDFIKIKQPDLQPPAAGKLLIAEPFLSDPSFTRSVVLLCELGNEGTVGFMLNKPMDVDLGDLIPELYTPYSIPVYQGGPVQKDTLHIIHRRHDLLGGMEIYPGIYWGGSFDALSKHVKEHTIEAQDIKLFAGYSGWSPGQLEQEMQSGAWLVGSAATDLLFDTEIKALWKLSVHRLGKEFAFMENMPLDPQLN